MIKLSGIKKHIVNTLIVLLSVIAVLFMLLFFWGFFDEGGVLYQYELQKSYDNGSRERVLSGSGTLEDPFLIRCKAELIMADEVVESDENGGLNIFSLENDIDLKIGDGSRCIMIGEGDDYIFRGTFLGNGHTIKNIELYPNENDEPVGLFTSLEGEVINLRLEGTAAGEAAGGIAGILEPSGYIENCISNVKAENGGSIAGVAYGRIINCVGLSDSNLCADALSEHENCYKKSGGFSIFTKVLDIKSGEIISAVSAVNRLNTNFGNMDPVDKHHPNNRWEVFTGISFSDKKADMVNKCRMNVMFGDTPVRLKGFYSLRNSAWVIPYPAGEIPENSVITLKNDKGEYSIRTQAGVYEYVSGVEDNEYRVLLYPYDDMPALYLTTTCDNGAEYLYADKANELPGSFSVLDTEKRTKTDETGMTLSCRGNDSYQHFTKWKGSFALTLNERIPVLGLPANEDFVLLAGYRKDSVLSYILEKDIAKSAGIPFAYDYRMVHLYIDGEYRGFYMLTGSQEIDEGRFDLTNSYAATASMNEQKLSDYGKIEDKNEETGEYKVYYDIPNEPADVTGGYLLELDFKDYPDSRSRFITKRGTTLTMKSNPYATKLQVEYAASLWQDFEDAIFSPTGYNAKGGRYTDYMDLDAMADLCLAMELTEDTSMSGSLYFYTDKGDGKLHAASRWDSEKAFTKNGETEGSWLGGDMHSKYTEEKVEFWHEIYVHDDFLRKLKDHWNNGYKQIFEKLLSEDMTDNADGVSSMAYYKQKYEKGCKLDNLRWEELDFERRHKKLNEFIEKRTKGFDEWINAIKISEEETTEEKSP